MGLDPQVEVQLQRKYPGMTSQEILRMLAADDLADKSLKAYAKNVLRAVNGE